MYPSLARNWGWVALRGLVAIVFGILAIVFPNETLRSLLLIFAIFAIVDGLIAIADAFTLGRRMERTGLFLGVGIFGLLIGIITLVVPHITVLILVYLIAMRAIVGGVNELALATHLRRENNYEWLLVISGVISILFGILVAIAPIRSLAIFILFIGVYAIFAGTTLLARAWDLRGTHLRGSNG